VMQNSTRPLANEANHDGARGSIVDVGPALRNIGMKRTTGDITKSYTTRGDSMGWGRFRGLQGGYFSWIFYRAYMEDLTVSGRTYAQVDAEDLALFTEQFAVGGRYHNDTFTNPTTIP